jgi:hypothetical protein
LIGSIRLLLTGEADRTRRESAGGMRLEAASYACLMDEFLDAADSADQQDAEQFLVACVASGALVEVAQRRAAGRGAQPLRAAWPAVAGVGGAATGERLGREDHSGAVSLIAAQGAYLNGWRTASPAVAPGTQKTSRLSSRRSATTDPRVAGVPIPLERDCLTVVVACVEFHEHDWLFLASASHL